MKKNILFRALVLLLAVCLAAALTGCGALNAYVEISNALEAMNETDDPESSTDAPQSSSKPTDENDPQSSSKPADENDPQSSFQPESDSTGDPQQTPGDNEFLITAEDSLEELRMIMQDSDYLAAIAFIGYIEGPMGDGYGELFRQNGYSFWYPFVEEIPYDRLVETDGWEMYCIVPRDEDASVAVNQWLMREYGGQVNGSTGNVLYRSESGEPILLLCNIDATVPNTDVTVTAPDGSWVNFHPSVTSYSDGTIRVNTSVELLDFTVPIVWSTGEQLAFEQLQGSWTCWDALTPAGDPLVCSLTFYQEDGADRVAYGYGVPESEFYEFFTGVCYESDQDPSVTLFEMELTGGVALEDIEPYEFRGAYRIEASQDSADAIIVTHMDGTPLVYGCEGGSFTFYRGNG
ncbi:MAG: hypothetical protein IJ412_02930 [Oscillospiraceae bacterium]|nr:hypothetical protein [Oscillospiraceae bacterium]